jgi:hypothetical protein
MVAASQTTGVPVIMPACGNGLMVIVWLAISVPHELVTAYITVSSPATIPVTEDDAPIGTMLAVVLLTDHVPPITVSEREISPASHTIAAPVITPACGNGLMVISCVVISVPHELDTV